MKQLGSIIDWGHPGQPPAAIMSRFLPKLFLRRAETDISTISRAADREISAICYSGHHVTCNFALKSFQTIPKVAACSQAQSLYFAFKGRRAFTIKGSALWILKCWNESLSPPPKQGEEEDIGYCCPRAAGPRATIANVFLLALFWGGW